MIICDEQMCYYSIKQTKTCILLKCLMVSGVVIYIYKYIYKADRNNEHSIVNSAACFVCYCIM